MPNRIIRESCRTSPTLDQLSDAAERMFWRLTTVCDDFGRFDADPRILLANCYPLRVDRMKPTSASKCIQEMADAGLVQLYKADGRLYGCFKTWEKHQIRRALKSKFPDPANICEQMLADDSKCLRGSEDPKNEERGYEEDIRSQERADGDRVVGHYVSRFGRRSYDLTPTRRRILDEALGIAGPEILCQAIDLYRDHKEFEFQRTRKDDGLCEYILRKGSRVGVRERLDWIFRKAGKELCFE